MAGLVWILGLQKISTPLCNDNLYLLFVTGKLEMATKIADFCSHALLALDVRTHPRAPYLERKVPVSSGLNYGAQGKAVFGSITY